MEWFEEIYGSYFQAVRKILLEAGKAPITIKEMEEICRRYASPESALAIVPKLTKGTWSPLLEEQEKHLFSSALRRPENLSAGKGLQCSKRGAFRAGASVSKR